MRGPGTAESEEAQEGFAQLEVALPTRLDDQYRIEHRESACNSKQNGS
jgi:hypothetical protein